MSNARRDFASPHVAIIGAGIAGLTGARMLRNHGCSVTVYEKSQGLGGRTATRRVEPGLSFDHGAQYFTVREKRFQAYIDQLIQQGIVAEWTGEIVQIKKSTVEATTEAPVRYVGVPGMTAIARDLAKDIPVDRSTKIDQLVWNENGWQLTDATGHLSGHFDCVIVALPAPQTALLLRNHSFAAQVRDVPMTPCWAVLVAFDQRIDVPWDGAFVHASSLSWVARNSSKPGRNPAKECWVLHASADWSLANLEQSRERVSDELISDFALSISRTLPLKIHVDAHRWMYSATPLSIDYVALCDPTSKLVISGDWLAGGRVEGAFRSGLAAAEQILKLIHTPVTHPDGDF